MPPCPNTTPLSRSYTSPGCSSSDHTHPSRELLQNPSSPGPSTVPLLFSHSFFHSSSKIALKHHLINPPLLVMSLPWHPTDDEMPALHCARQSSHGLAYVGPPRLLFPHSPGSPSTPPTLPSSALTWLYPAWAYQLLKHADSIAALSLCTCCSLYLECLFRVCYSVTASKQLTSLPSQITLPPPAFFLPGSYLFLFVRKNFPLTCNSIGGPVGPCIYYVMKVPDK